MNDCEMFLIRTYRIEEGGYEFSTTKEDYYIYCPVKELRYLVDNENDSSVIKWFYIKRAYRMRDMSQVKSEEIFGK